MSINSSIDSLQLRLETTLNQMKQFKCSVICLFGSLAVFVLLLCSTTITIELRLKNDNTKSFFAQKELQLFLSIIFNLSIMIAFIFVLRNFFAMLKTIGMRNAIKLLKSMLVVLAISFFFRAAFTGAIVYLYKLGSNEKWTAACTLLVTCYLFFGELVPITFVFVYHVYSGPQFSNEENKPSL